MTWGPGWLAWTLIAVIAICYWRAWVSMGTVVEATFPPDGRPVLTHRVMLKGLRRAMIWSGRATFAMGIFLIGSGSAIGPLAVGLMMAVFPGFWSAPVVKAWMPTGDHREPIGPEDSYFRRNPQPCVQLEKPAGPPTLNDWLED